MNKRLKKKELRREVEGREGHKEKKRKEQEKRERYKKKKKKNPTDVVCAVPRAASRVRGGLPLLLAPNLMCRHPRTPPGGEQWPWRRVKML